MVVVTDKAISVLAPAGAGIELLLLIKSMWCSFLSRLTLVQRNERLTQVNINRGQYSDAVLNELESQNDQQVEGILGKVKVLKDVCFYPHQCLFLVALG